MFETIIDARKGTVAVNRIYKGNTLVWSRYNWEKWSCETRYSSGRLSLRRSGGVNTISASTSVNGGSFYQTYSSGTNTMTFTNSGSSYGDTTPKTMYDNYYRYIPESKEIHEGGSVGLMSGISQDKSEITLTAYEAYYIPGSSYSVKGSTNYGIVTGNQGDYPSNGRHSDGYWYVSVGAMGFEEEEGNP